MRALLVMLLISIPALAEAQERISLSEIVPALEGTEVGAIDLGPAPAPGSVRVVQRAEVIAALRAAGRSHEGLVIPRSARIRRDPQTLSGDELVHRARSAIESSLAPCDVGTITIRGAATLGPGEIEIHAEGPARPAGSMAMVTIVVSNGGRSVRVPAQVVIECPAPVIQPGARVRVSIVMGNVRASADGVARQQGRVGDRVRVHIDATGALIEARVIDAQNVEVVR